MEASEELKHLRAGIWPEPALDDQDCLAATCPSGTAGVLLRSQEALGIVLERGAGDWPSVEEWARLLPGWFVEACLDDALVQNCILDRWSLRGWLHWLRPENRRWFWWSAMPTAENVLTITLLIPERPYLRGAFDWLLKAAGATKVQKLAPPPAGGETPTAWSGRR